MEVVRWSQSGAMTTGRSHEKGENNGATLFLLHVLSRTFDFPYGAIPRGEQTAARQSARGREPLSPRSANFATNRRQSLPSTSALPNPSRAFLPLAKNYATRYICKMRGDNLMNDGGSFRTAFSNLLLRVDPFAVAGEGIMSVGTQ